MREKNCLNSLQCILKRGFMEVFNGHTSYIFKYFVFMEGFMGEFAL